MLRWSIQRINAMLLCIVYAILFVNIVDMKIKARNALNAMLVGIVNATVKTHPHIPTHNFLNIQSIFNLKKVLESWDWGIFKYTIKYYICWHCWYKLWHSVQNIIHSMLCMLTLLIQLKCPDSELSKTLNGLKIGWILRKLWTEMYVEYVRARNTSVFVSTVSTNNITYTIQYIWSLCWQCQQTT